MSTNLKRPSSAIGFASRLSSGERAPVLKDGPAVRHERDEKLLDYLVKKDREIILELAKR